VDNSNVEIQFKKEHFLRRNIFGVLISRGSVATHLRPGRHYYMSFVAYFVVFLEVKEH